MLQNWENGVRDRTKPRKKSVKPRGHEQKLWFSCDASEPKQVWANPRPLYFGRRSFTWREADLINNASNEPFFFATCRHGF